MMKELDNFKVKNKNPKHNDERVRMQSTSTQKFNFKLKIVLRTEQGKLLTIRPLA